MNQKRKKKDFSEINLKNQEGNILNTKIEEIK